MLATKKQLAVRLARFIPKLNNEGQKLVTVSLTMAEAKGAIRGALSEAVACMKANDSLDGINCDEEMESVALLFSSPATPEKIDKGFEITNLFGFSLAREKTTQSGTLNSEKSGRIEVDFRFTVPLIEGGVWAVNNYSNDLLLTIEKSQGELPLAPAEDNPDSQEARNNRVTEAEGEDSPADNTKPKRSHKKKG